jgi:hypothetical protein
VPGDHTQDPRAGLDDDTQELLKGYITHVKPKFGAGLHDNYLEIWGMDASVLMDRADVLKDWPGKKDSDIATEIFNSYGLTPTVEDTGLVHDNQVSTIIQRETDIQFLKTTVTRAELFGLLEANIRANAERL